MDSNLEESALSLARRGDRVKDIADSLGMNIHQFYRWRREHPQVDAELREIFTARKTVAPPADKPRPLFDGPPETPAEVWRRATIIRMLRACSSAEIGPGARV